MPRAIEIQNFLNKEVALILRLNESEMNIDASLNDLGIDSMSFVELLIAIENKFGVQLIQAGITKADLSSLKTLALRIEKEL
ncbi:MAG: acyl carrier protein [Lentisphaerota bacterium]